MVPFYPQDRVMTSAEFLRKGITREVDGYDKTFTTFFVAAMVRRNPMTEGKNRITLDLSESPIVVQNEDWRSRLKLHPNTPTVDYMRGLGSLPERDKAMYGDYSLVSGGSIVFWNIDGTQHLLGLTRDQYANADKGLITTPAGRMDCWPSEVSAVELLEEMGIIVFFEGKYRLLVQHNSKLSREKAELAKWKQLVALKDHLRLTGEVDELKLLEEISGPTDFLFQNLDEVGVNNFNDVRVHQLRTVYNHQLMDFCNGFVHLDLPTNTLEYREVYNLTMDGARFERIIPWEVYGPIGKGIRNTPCLLKEAELLGLARSGKTVATLSGYAEEVANNTAINFFKAA